MKKIHLIKTQGKSLIDDKNNMENIDGTIQPVMDFETLLQVYEFSSLISGIIEKISTRANTGFEKTDNQELDDFLNNLDIELIVKNLLIFGNVFFERLRNLKGELTNNLNYLPTVNMYIADKKQDFAYLYKKNLEKVKFKKEEVLFLKRVSVSSKEYGDSIFSKSIDELTLLAYITKYYKKFFASGNIEPTILYDENSQLTDEQITVIENMIKDHISGIDNSHTTVIVPSKLGKIDLSTKIDPDKFIKLKRELKEDIAIATNIPFDLLSSQNSNRATSLTAIKQLYENVIFPLQARLTQQIKQQLIDWGFDKKDVEKIRFKNPNLTDPKEEMTVLTGYQAQGVLSVNEVRGKLGLEKIEDGDDYVFLGKAPQRLDPTDEIFNELEKAYEK